MLAYPPKYCSVCGGALSVHRVVHGFCENAACRTTVGQRWLVKKQADEQDAIQATAHDFRDALVAQLPQLKSNDVQVLVVPGLESSLLPMVESRRDTLRAHIEALLIEPASAVVDDDALVASTAVVDSVTEKVVAAACSTCRGFCCRKGGDSAYLDASTMARVRFQQPTLRSEDIAAVYVNAVPAESVHNSCIYHGQQGCTLPRDFRAQICNQYFCGALETWLAKSADMQLKPVSITMIRNSAVVRSVLFDEQLP